MHDESSGATPGPPIRLRPNAGKLSPADKLIAVDRYQHGETSVAIGASLGVTKTAIQRLLKRRGIVLRPPRVTSRRYRLDERYFDAISTEAQAYWLGFLAADGCVRLGAQLRVTLAAQDRDHLLRLAEALGTDAPLDTLCHGGRRYAGLRCWSPVLVADLARHGVVERKTPLVAWPATVPAHLLRHYLRGYADGDGWVCVRPWQSNSLEWGLVANLGFLRDCALFLQEAVGLRPPGIRRRHQEKPYGSMSYHGRLQVSRLLCYLNEGATIWLPRKRDKVASFLA